MEGWRADAAAWTGAVAGPRPMFGDRNLQQQESGSDRTRVHSVAPGRRPGEGGGAASAAAPYEVRARALLDCKVAT